MGENGLNQTLSIVWLKFPNDFSDPKATGTPTSTMAEVNSKVASIDVAKNTDGIRTYVSPDLKRRIKAIVGLKNSGKDWTMSDIVAEALEDWLKKSENAELIKRHKLDEIES